MNDVIAVRQILLCMMFACILAAAASAIKPGRRFTIAALMGLAITPFAIRTIYYWLS